MKIPRKFKSEKEEAEFWDKHSIVDFLEDTEEVSSPKLSAEAKDNIIPPA